MPVLIDAALSLERTKPDGLGVAFGVDAATGVAAATAAANSGPAATTASAFAAGWSTGAVTASGADAWALTVHRRSRDDGIHGRCGGCRNPRRRFRRRGCRCRCCRSGLCRVAGPLRCRCNRLRSLDGRCTGGNRRRGNCQRPCVAGDAGATIASVVATGAAIATATGAGVTTVDAAGCADAAGSTVAVSGVATMSEAASLTAVFTMPGFATPGFAGLLAASAPGIGGNGLRRRRVACPAKGCSGPRSKKLRGRAAMPAVRGRGWFVGTRRGEADPARTVRSLPAVSAALLSISAEKLSGAGDWSARADRDGAFGTDRLAAVSDVTLNTGGLSRVIPPIRSARTGPRRLSK